MAVSFVVTGFLGSGKTTFILNSVRNHLKDKRVAIIVNEFGEIGVDGKVLKNVYSEVVEIEEGCICCKLTKEFEEAVLNLLGEYNPDIIMVETSGTSEPFPVVFSLKMLNVPVEGIICLIDSKNFNKYSEESTALYQIGSSNIIVLNKTDLIEEENLKEIEEEIRRIKESYRIENMFVKEDKKLIYKIYRSSYGTVPQEVFMGTGTPLLVKESFNKHKNTYKSKVLKIEEDISYEDFISLINNLPDTVIRAKGIIKLKGFPAPVPVNYIFGDIEFGEPFEDYKGDYFLVLIG